MSGHGFQVSFSSEVTCCCLAAFFICPHISNVLVKLVSSIVPSPGEAWTVFSIPVIESLISLKPPGPGNRDPLYNNPKTWFSLHDTPLPTHNRQILHVTHAAPGEEISTQVPKIGFVALSVRNAQGKS